VKEYKRSVCLTDCVEVLVDMKMSASLNVLNCNTSTCMKMAAELKMGMQRWGIAGLKI
jgi:hypothetical protein